MYFVVGILKKMLLLKMFLHLMKVSMLLLEMNMIELIFTNVELKVLGLIQKPNILNIYLFL